MINLPNPFVEFAGRAEHAPANSAAACAQTHICPAAASPFIESALERVIAADVSAAPVLTDSPVAAADDHRFNFDVDAFMNDIEPLPAFLRAPSQGYLEASEIIPVLEVLAGH